MTQLTKHLSCRVDARTHKAFQRRIKPLDSSVVLRELISAVIDGELTAAIVALTAALSAPDAPRSPPAIAVPVQALPPAMPVTVAIPPPVVAAAPAMPAPPFQAPTAPAAPAPAFMAPPVATAPFTDTKGLVGYVMETYKALGPAKGGDIQKVLSGLGYGNINDVKPEHFGALYAGIEALKL